MGVRGTPHPKGVDCSKMVTPRCGYSVQNRRRLPSNLNKLDRTRLLSIKIMVTRGDGGVHPVIAYFIIISFFNLVFDLCTHGEYAQDDIRTPSRNSAVIPAFLRFEYRHTSQLLLGSPYHANIPRAAPSEHFLELHNSSSSSAFETGFTWLICYNAS
jgi:hypothetical protein